MTFRGKKRVRGMSQNNEQLFMATCAVNWIKYCAVFLKQPCCQTPLGFDK